MGKFLKKGDGSDRPRRAPRPYPQRLVGYPYGELGRVMPWPFFTMPKLTGFTDSDHSMEQMLFRNVTQEDVEDVVENPVVMLFKADTKRWIFVNEYCCVILSYEGLLVSCWADNEACEYFPRMHDLLRDCGIE